MICDRCEKVNSVNYRVTSSQTSDWIFICENCWLDFSKTKGYKYGGTRKNNKRKKVNKTH